MWSVDGRVEMEEGRRWKSGVEKEWIRRKSGEDIKPDSPIIVSKDRLQQILVNLIIVNNKRINTQKYFSNYMKEKRVRHQVQNPIY